MNILDILLGDSTQERTVTIKTKPQKKEAAPEMPLDQGSANIPQGILDLLHAGNRAQMAAEQDRNSQLRQLLGLGGVGGEIPQGMVPAAPVFDPMAGQKPMDFSVAGGFNPYGG